MFHNGNKIILLHQNNILKFVPVLFCFIVLFYNGYKIKYFTNFQITKTVSLLSKHKYEVKQFSFSFLLTVLDTRMYFSKISL